MAETERYARLDPEQLEVLHEAERPPLRLRWWLVIPLAVLLSCLQAFLNLKFEFSGTNTFLISSQVSIMAFSFLFLLVFVLNQTLRLWWPLGLLVVACLGQIILGLLPLLGWNVFQPGRSVQGIVLTTVQACMVAVAAISALSLARSQGRWASALSLAVTMAVYGLMAFLTQLGGLKALGPLQQSFESLAAGVAGPRFHVLHGALLTAAAVVFVVLLAMDSRTRSGLSITAFAVMAALPLLFGLAVSETVSARALMLVRALSLVSFPIIGCMASFFLARKLAAGMSRSLITPFNRGEMIAIFAAMFVSGGIASFGLVDQLVPLIIGPKNPAWNNRQRQWDKYVIPHLNENLFISDTDAIQAMRSGYPGDPHIWSKVRWDLWVKPLACWGVFIAGVYLLFYALAMLLYQSWARREKLVFPLARLPEDMLEDPGARPGSMPSTLKSSLFWTGFIIVVVILGYNAAVQAGWIRLKPLYLGIQQETLMKSLETTVFKGISDNGAPRLFTMYFIFVAVGIAYLLPLEISASMWIYNLGSIGLIVVGIWTAAGTSSRSFPSDWLWENSFVSALGAGGMLAFAASYLIKAIHERWVFAREWSEERGKVSFLRFAGRFFLGFGWGGVLFLAALTIIVGWLVWSGVPIHWAILFISIVILTTVGLMRVVAEGGMYWFQLHVSPFHLARLTHLAGTGNPATASAIASLMPTYSILFLDTKDFLAPAVLNSFKMQDETRASRRTFHLTVILAILATMIVSVIVILLLGYEKGVNRGNKWFWTGGPQGLLDQTMRLVSGVGLRVDTGWITYLYIIGAAWVILSILMRRRFFWWLHPIGFAMIANPLAAHLWFSFFLGWLCKKVTVKYGGRHMYAKIRPFFIGIILGEVLSCFFWSVVANVFELNIRVDINRYNPHPY